MNKTSLMTPYEHGINLGKIIIKANGSNIDCRKATCPSITEISVFLLFCWI